MKITFLLGAGCEGKGQIGMSSGAKFQRKTILAKNVKDLINNLNNECDIRNGSFLTSNSTSVLYQTIKRMKKQNTYMNFKWDEKQEKTIEEYLEYKEGKTLKEKNKSIIDEFSNLYKTEIYNKLDNYDIENPQSNSPNLNCFLENVCFYSFADSLFNYLSDPDLYIKEANKVMKLYYSAYNCILDDLKTINKIKENINLKHENDLYVRRKQFFEYVDSLQKKVIEHKKSEEQIYYNIISKSFENKLNDYVNVVTTNYTNFSQEIIGLKDENIAFVHGKLDLFESLKSKHVGPIEDFSADEKIIPFIFVQSGIKPVVNARQIKEFAKAVDMILESDYLIVLGYGVNYDDEHIVNLLRERIKNQKKIIYFIYCDRENKNEIVDYMNNKQNEINALLFNENNDMVEYHSTNEFQKILMELDKEN